LTSKLLDSVSARDKLIGLLPLPQEQLGPPRQHLLFTGWAVTHVSFPAARRVLQLAGGPAFLQRFLACSRPARSFCDLSAFRRDEQRREEFAYFRKTDLADCDKTEFKQLFGLVTHEEAESIRKRAMVSRRRQLRAKSNLLKNRSGPEDTGKFLKPPSLRVEARRRQVLEEPLVTGALLPHLARMARETCAPPPPQVISHIHVSSHLCVLFNSLCTCSVLLCH
jgi:hypothetical protein